jgi:hypothetical protein
LRIVSRRARSLLVIIGFGDVGDLFDADGLLKPMATLTPEQRALIAGIDVMQETEHRGRVIKVRLRDQLRALELLARHKAMFPKEEPAPPSMQVATVVKIINEHHPGPSRGPADYHAGNGNENGHAKAVPLAPALPAARGNGH